MFVSADIIVLDKYLIFLTIYALSLYYCIIGEFSYSFTLNAYLKYVYNFEVGVRSIKTRMLHLNKLNTNYYN